LGIGDWAQSPIPNPQSPIPNPHKCIKKTIFLEIKLLDFINTLKDILFQFKKIKKYWKIKVYHLALIFLKQILILFYNNPSVIRLKTIWVPFLLKLIPSAKNLITFCPFLKVSGLSESFRISLNTKFGVSLLFSLIS